MSYIAVQGYENDVKGRPGYHCGEGEILKTILIVDDDCHALKFLRDLMLHLGYEVVAKPDGLAAFSVVKQGEAVDLVITDYQMPGMNGLELLASLKQTAPSIPVIMVSAEPGADIYLKAKALGAAECLEKPVDLQALLQVVEDTLAQTLT